MPWVAGQGRTSGGISSKIPRIPRVGLDPVKARTRTGSQVLAPLFGRRQVPARLTFAGLNGLFVEEPVEIFVLPKEFVPVCGFHSTGCGSMFRRGMSTSQRGPRVFFLHGWSEKDHVLDVGQNHHLCTFKEADSMLS